MNIPQMIPVGSLPGSPLQDDIQFDPASRYVTPGAVGGNFRFVFCFHRFVY